MKFFLHFFVNTLFFRSASVERFFLCVFSEISIILIEKKVMKILKEIPYYRLCGLTEWRMVKGYPRYSVSCNGEVLNWSWRKTKIPKLCKLNDNGLGYMLVGMDGKMVLVHRLVAEAFHQNQQNKPEVDHINCKRWDNRVENLRWATREENMSNVVTIRNWSPKSLLGKFGIEHPKSKQIVQLDMEKQIIKKWGSSREIERELGIDHRLISECCRGKRNSVGGFKWMFLSDINSI